MIKGVIARMAAIVMCAAMLVSCGSEDMTVSPTGTVEPRTPSATVTLTTTAEASATPSTDPELHGTTWQLVSVDGEQIADDTIVTLEIDEAIDGAMGGDLVCNSYSFFATLADDGTIIPETGQAEERWLMTQEGCTTATLTVEEYNDLTNQYLTILTDVTSYEVEDNALRISTPDGRVLVYRRV